MAQREPNDTPLITPGSPSYARAARTRNEPATPEAVAVGRLLDLLERELGHVAVAEHAADQLSEDLASHVLASAKRARSRSQDLGNLIRELGGSSIDEGEADPGILPVGIAELVSARDESELRSRLDEQAAHIASAYRSVASELALPESIEAGLNELAAKVV